MYNQLRTCLFARRQEDRQLTFNILKRLSRSIGLNSNPRLNRVGNNWFNVLKKMYKFIIIIIIYMVRWCNGYDVGLAMERLRVRLPAERFHVDDVDLENFTGAGCCLYAGIQITNYDNVIH